MFFIIVDSSKNNSNFYPSILKQYIWLNDWVSEWGILLTREAVGLFYAKWLGNSIHCILHFLCVVSKEGIFFMGSIEYE